jgi:hypothetical protein
VVSRGKEVAQAAARFRAEGRRREANGVEAEADGMVADGGGGV